VSSPTKVRVRVGDRELEAEVHPLGGSRYRVVIEGKEFEVEVATAATPTPIAKPVIPVAKPVTPTPVAPPTPAPAPVAGGNVVKAPISGKVLKVLVKPGDAVEPRTVVATLESMKMELEVYAGRSGRVKEVLVKPGDSVQTGQPIVVLE